MIHYFIGNLGHLFVISTFVLSLVSFFSYYKATVNKQLSNQWLVNGRMAFFAQSVSVIGIGVSLFYIIANHYFEYHYAYSYSDRRLPGYYLISTFWNGQEGSFLLWMFWNSVLGVALLLTNKYWEAPVMTVFALVQAFLASMVLGVVIPGLSLKIGSSPFILLRDAMQDPVFKKNPDFVPADGTGLNPLLQNYWMIIHPPTLFLGFASTLVPFSFCIAGLWRKRLTEWIRPAMPWSLFSGAILGLGILMGGYWAYETLNFGGYWNWDPVENAVYVPWLVLIGAIHSMISFRNSKTALRTAVILVISVFILVLYSTFLTRSGILGDASVHAFTDLGLSGQLLIYLFAFIIIAVVLIVRRWKNMPASTKEIKTYTREFWIFIGATVLCLMGFQVLLPTSIPVWNKIVALVGGTSNMAPPADQLAYYSKFQLWFATTIALLSGIGQYFWWMKEDSSTVIKRLLNPLLVSALLLVVMLQFIDVREGGLRSIAYLFLLFSGLFTVAANFKILLSLWKSSPGLSGGSVAHIGIGAMLVGILFSAGYSKVVSLNQSGRLISRQFDDTFNRENLILFLNEPKQMGSYDLEYEGEYVEPRHKSGYVAKEDIFATDDPYKVRARRDIFSNGEKLYNARDTFEISPENTYYKIVFKKDGKQKAVLYPRAQINPRMGFIASPDIQRNLSRDIYTHVTATMQPDSKQDWSKTKEQDVQLNQTFYANDYVAAVKKIERVYEIDGVALDSSDIAVKATIQVQGEEKNYTAEPVFLIRNNAPGVVPDEINALGLRLSLVNIHPQTNEFTIGIQTRQKDWVVIKAVEKPLINILWAGAGIVMIGFGMSITRRFREFRKMRDKGLE